MNAYMPYLLMVLELISILGRADARFLFKQKRKIMFVGKA